MKIRQISCQHTKHARGVTTFCRENGEPSAHRAQLVDRLIYR